MESDSLNQRELQKLNSNNYSTTQSFLQPLRTALRRARPCCQKHTWEVFRILDGVMDSPIPSEKVVGDDRCSRHGGSEHTIPPKVSPKNQPRRSVEPSDPTDRSGPWNIGHDPHP